MKEIRAILLNGKHVKFPLDYDVKEGWVEFEILKPTGTDSLIKAGESVDIEKNQILHEYRIRLNNQEPNWERRKEFGIVEVIYV